MADFPHPPSLSGGGRLSPDGGPAFPHGDPTNGGDPGAVTLRDYFAAKALSGLCFGRRENVETFAKEAYAIADAMLKARET